MATIKQLQLPDDLLQAIEKRASEQGISVEQQVVQDLSLVEAGAEYLSEPQLITAIRAERDALAAKGVYLTDEVLQAAKRWGRK